MWISRKFTDLLYTFLKQFSTVVITGARQVGKTSILKENFKEFNYVSFDELIILVILDT